MPITSDHIVSAFIGSGIGVVCSGGYEKLKSIRKINRARKSVIKYLQSVCDEKLQAYLRDCRAAIGIIEDKVLKSGGISHVYDTMPMLTSEFFRTIGNEMLERVCLSNDDFFKLLTFYFRIDYLKKTMAHEFVSEYASWWREHYKTHKAELNTLIKSPETHFKHCEAVEDKRKFYTVDIQHRIKIAEELLEDLKYLCNKYGRNGYKWYFKYMNK